MPAPLFASPEPDRDHFRVLVADDNDVFRAAFRGLLACLGHTAEVASNGREAVEMASRETFDIVFLDIQMPVMGGFEAAEMIRHNPTDLSRTRIIGLSAHAEYSRNSAAAVMDDFLVKPVRLANLVQVLKHCSPACA